MRSARRTTVVALTSIFSLIVSGVGAAQSAAPQEPITVTAEGELVKRYVDFPTPTHSPNLGTHAGDDDAHHEALAEDQSDPTAKSDDDANDVIQYTLRTEEGDVPLTDSEGVLGSVPSGDQVLVNLEVPTRAAQSALGVSHSHEELTVSAEELTAVAEVTSAPLAVSQVTSVAAATSATGSGQHKVYIAIPTVAGASNNPTEETARNLIAEASTYWSSQTFGRIKGLSVAEVKTYRTSLTATQLCALTSMSATDATWAEAQRKTSYTPGSRKHLFVLTPPCSNGSGQALGLAEVGSNLATGGRIIVNEAGAHTVIHEFGHNFSLGHANLQSIYSSGTYTYMGLYSPMSGSVPSNYGTIPSLDVAYQHKLGLLPTNQIHTVLGSQTVTLDPVSGTTGTRGAVFYDPVTGSKVYLEYRSGTHFDGQALYLSPLLEQAVPEIRYGAGVRVYVLEEGTSDLENDTGTYAPQVGSDRFITALRQGESFKVEASGWSVNVTSIASGKAKVSLSVPKAPSRVKAQNVGTTYGKAATLKATVSSNAPTGGTLYARINGKEVARTEVSAKAGSKSVSLTLPKNLAVGKHTVALSLSGTKAAKGASASATVTVSKAKPKVNVKVSNTYLKYRPQVAITATSSSTPSGKATVYVDGKKYKTVSLKNGKATVRLSAKLKKGKHSVKVKYAGTSKFSSVTTSKSFTVKKKTGKISGFATGTVKVKVGKKYKDTFSVNHAAKIQVKKSGKWKTIRSVSEGKRTFTFTAPKKTGKHYYRVTISGSSKVKEKTSKTLTIRVTK